MPRTPKPVKGLYAVAMLEYRVPIESINMVSVVEAVKAHACEAGGAATLVSFSISRQKETHRKPKIDFGALLEIAESKNHPILTDDPPVKP